MFINSVPISRPVESKMGVHGDCERSGLGSALTSGPGWTSSPKEKPRILMRGSVQFGDIQPSATRPERDQADSLTLRWGRFSSERPFSIDSASMMYVVPL